MTESKAKGDWYCMNCGYVSDECVTYDEACCRCGAEVVFHPVVPSFEEGVKAIAAECTARPDMEDIIRHNLGHLAKPAMTEDKARKLAEKIVEDGEVGTVGLQCKVCKGYVSPRLTKRGGLTLRCYGCGTPLDINGVADVITLTADELTALLMEDDHDTQS